MLKVPRITHRKPLRSRWSLSQARRSSTPRTVRCMTQASSTEAAIRLHAEVAKAVVAAQCRHSCSGGGMCRMLQRGRHEVAVDDDEHCSKWRVRRWTPTRLPLHQSQDHFRSACRVEFLQPIPPSQRHMHIASTSYVSRSINAALCACHMSGNDACIDDDVQAPSPEPRVHRHLM